jgi:uncharacterized damage-inducible protein DinB
MLRFFTTIELSLDRAYARVIAEEGAAMTDSEILRTMARYNQWANRDLFAAVRTLPQGEATKHRPTLFKNILKTLNHPLVADRMWWAHMHKESHHHKALNELLYSDFEELAAAREEMDQRLIDYVDNLSEADADEKINFTLLSGAKGGMNRRMILMHMFNHNTYHRGFVVETFCQVPAALPLIDLPIFMRGAGGMRFFPPHLDAANKQAAPKSSAA